MTTLVTTPAGAWLLGYTPETGLLVAIYTALDDSLSSFIKRRLANSWRHLLDQVPESILPAFMMMQTY